MTSRLPRTAIPSHYDLVIRTDLLRQSFSGTCEILLEVTEPIAFINIHVNSPLRLQTVVLEECSADGSARETRKLVEKTIDEKLQRAKLEFEGGMIQRGSYKLGFVFEGALSESLAGYYLGSYNDSGRGKEEKKFYTMTQFQPCKLVSLTLSSSDIDSDQS